MSKPTEHRVPLRAFLSDSLIFGVGSLAERLIAFLFLPITSGILGAAGFGIYNLYGTASAILFMLCAVGMPGAYFRFATDDAAAQDEVAVLDVALLVVHVTSLLWIPPALFFAAPAADVLLGAREPWFIYWLCLRTYSEVVGSLADCRLQAAGKTKLFVSLRVPAAVSVRLISLATLIYYRTPLALAAGEALSMAFVTLLISVYVMRGARLRVDAALARKMVQYGSSSIPGMVSGWALLAANRYLLKGLAPGGIRDVGLFSLAERFASIVLLFGHTFWLGWRRFGFRNMHLPDGPQILAKGLTFYFAGTALVTLGVAMLGPATVHLLINQEFAAAAAIIAPLSLGAFVSVINNPLRMGLMKENRMITLSGLIMLSAIATIALAVLWIPSHTGVGAAWASVIGQALGVALTVVVAQRLFPMPIEVRRLAGISVVFLAAYAIVQPAALLGWAISLGVGILVLGLLPFALYFFGPLTQDERTQIAGYVNQALSRVRSRNSAGE